MARATSKPPAEKPPTLRERNRARTRKAILDAVVEIELAHGGALRPEIATFAKIAEIAGVSERTVYRMFPSRRELDHAYAREQPLLAGVTPSAELEARPNMIRDITRVWSRRFGRRLQEIERQQWAVDCPESLAARAARDDDTLARTTALIGSSLPERQVRAIAAALQSTSSVPTIVASAQRWELTLEEAGEAHAWVLEMLIESLSAEEIRPWNLPE